jgi:hypothetical protein
VSFQAWFLQAWTNIGSHAEFNFFDKSTVNRSTVKPCAWCQKIQIVNLKVFIKINKEFFGAHISDGLIFA